MNAETLQYLLGVERQLFQFVVRGLGCRELHEFHLVELVLPDETPRVLSIRARLGTEAGRIGHVVDGQRFFLQDLLLMDVGHGNLGRGDEVIIKTLDLEEILGEFRELSCSGHTLLVHHEGREDFRVSVCARVEVEHEVDEGPFELGAEPAIKREPRSCDLRAPREIENIEVFPDLPVGFRDEVEDGFFAPGPHDGIVFRTCAVGHRFMGNIRDDHHHVAERVLRFLQKFIQFLDPGRDIRHPGDDCGGVFFLHLFPADFLGGLISLAPHGFHFLKDIPPLCLHTGETVKVDVLTPLEHLASHKIEIFPEKFNVEHGLVSSYLFHNEAV